MLYYKLLEEFLE